jgi:hypothetical protein
MRVDDLCYWIKERHSIYTKKQAGEPKPWTQDPILQSYRFCNVYRNLDTVTEWIHNNWMNRSDPNMFVAMAIARFVNWPDTLEEMGFPLPWDPEHFVSVLHDRRRRNEKVYSGAYIVSTNGHAMDKAEYLANFVIQPIWDNRIDVRPKKGDTLESFYQRLIKFDGLGSFMAGQVIADLKYDKFSPLYEASDEFSWATSGPGSRRGMNRVIQRPPAAPITERVWRENLVILHKAVQDRLAPLGMPPLCAQDLQNALCEFDKFERVRLGEGTPRSGYPGRG